MIKKKTCTTINFGVQWITNINIISKRSGANPPTPPAGQKSPILCESRTRA